MSLVVVTKLLTYMVVTGAGKKGRKLLSSEKITRKRLSYAKRNASWTLSKFDFHNRFFDFDRTKVQNRAAGR